MVQQASQSDQICSIRCVLYHLRTIYVCYRNALGVCSASMLVSIGGYTCGKKLINEMRNCPVCISLFCCSARVMLQECTSILGQLCTYLCYELHLILFKLWSTSYFSLFIYQFIILLVSSLQKSLKIPIISDILSAITLSFFYELFIRQSSSSPTVS